MKKLLFGIIPVMFAGCAAPPNEAALEAEIEAVLNLYVQSVNEADYDLLRDIWVPSDDISYVSPFDRLQSSEQLEGFWQVFITDNFSERDLRLSDIALHVAGNEAAWAVFDWDFDATTSDGQPFSSTGWETQFYQLTDQGWRIEHIHYSMPLQPEDDSVSSEEPTGQ